MAETTITISSEEINLLIYSYLLDCGFTHSAFTICQEGHLERSPKFKKHIPRGELAELLSKSLLYSEVESHYQGGDAVAQCRSTFSLLEPHICSSNPPPADSSTSFNTISITKPIPQRTPFTKPESSIFVAPKRKHSQPPATQEKPDENPQKSSKNLPQDAPMDVDKPMTVDTMLNMGRGLRKLNGHTAEVFVCLFHPSNPHLIATGAKNGSLNIWTLPNPLDSTQNTASPVPITVNIALPGQTGVDITSVHWNHDGSQIAIASYDSALRLCNNDGTLLVSFRNHAGPIFTTRFSPNGEYLLSASLDGTTCLYDIQQKIIKRTFNPHKDCVLDIIWLNNKLFASAGADAIIYIQDISSSTPVKTLIGHANEINQIRTNADMTKLASCSDDKTVRIWNISDIASSLDDGIPGLSSNTIDKALVIDAHEHAVTALAWCETKEHSFIITGSFDATAKIWDTNNGQCLRIVRDFSRPVYAVSASPDGMWCVSAGADGKLMVQNVTDPDKDWSWTVNSERPGIFDIDWRTWPDGTEYLAVALEDHAAQVFDIKKIKSVQAGITS